MPWLPHALSLPRVILGTCRWWTLSAHDVNRCGRRTTAYVRYQEWQRQIQPTVADSQLVDMAWHAQSHAILNFIHNPPALLDSLHFTPLCQCRSHYKMSTPHTPQHQTSSKARSLLSQLLPWEVWTSKCHISFAAPDDVQHMFCNLLIEPTVVTHEKGARKINTASSFTWPDMPSHMKETPCTTHQRYSTSLHSTPLCQRRSHYKMSTPHTPQHQTSSKARSLLSQLLPWEVWTSKCHISFAAPDDVQHMFCNLLIEPTVVTHEKGARKINTASTFTWPDMPYNTKPPPKQEAY